MSKITFLGIAGNDAAVSRSSAGFVLNYGKYQIHIDPGHSSLIKSKEFNINPSNTNIVLASHNHLTHCNDLNILIDAITYKGLDQRGIIIGDESIIHGTNLERPILSRTHQRYVEKYQSLHHGENLKLPSMKIDALKTQHSNPTNIGFKLTTDEFTLTYSSDTGFFDDMISLYKNTDILVLNTPFTEKTKTKENLTTKNAQSIINLIKPRLAIITHFSNQILKDNPLYEAREIQKQTDVQTVAAKEGLTFNPQNYTKRSRQKTLVRF